MFNICGMATAEFFQETRGRFWELRKINETRKAELERWARQHPFFAAMTSAPMRFASLGSLILTSGIVPSEYVPILRDGHVIANAATGGKSTTELVQQAGMSYALRVSTGVSAGGMTIGVPTIATLRYVAEHFPS